MKASKSRWGVWENYSDTFEVRFGNDVGDTVERQYRLSPSGVGLWLVAIHKAHEDGDFSLSDILYWVDSIVEWSA